MTAHVRLAVRAALAVMAIVAALLWGAATALAVDPSPTPAGAGDVRTNPTAPGIVGDPLLAVVGVAAIALLAVVLTLAAARLADRR